MYIYVYIKYEVDKRGTALTLIKTFDLTRACSMHVINAKTDPGRIGQTNLADVPRYSGVTSMISNVPKDLFAA